MSLPTLMEAVKRHQFARVDGRIVDPVPLDEVYAANVASGEAVAERIEADRIADRRRVAEARRLAAEAHRRARQDAWAEEWGARNG